MGSYAVKMRRELHQYPEIGFDLPKTLAIVRRELDAMGVGYTEQYGKSSIVATVNPEKAHYTIGIRADMDALPITEKNEVPYKSKIEGQMHACGHDAHTAILLDTVRRINEMRDEIACRVMFVFQAAEEYAPGGGKLIVEDGLMEEIDCMVALHTDCRYDCGKLAFLSGPGGAISNGFYLHFYGKSAHAAQQQKGVDAIAMAVKAYMAIELTVAKEVAAAERCIFNVGSFHGGASNNSLCDECTLFCTLRTWSEEMDTHMEGRIKKIIEAVAHESGGSAAFERAKHYPYVYNDEAVVERLKEAARAVVGEENILPHSRAMGGEDFAFYSRKKPSAMFRLGTRNEAKGYTVLAHQDTFDIDEDALQIGADMFVTFVKQNCRSRRTDR